MRLRLPMLVGLVALATALPARGGPADNTTSGELDLALIERAWDDALVNHDTAALSRILTDDYVLTTPYGQVVTKSQLLASLRTPRGDGFEMRKADHDEVSARFYGHVVVVRSRFTLLGRVGGKDVVTPFRHTDVFVKQDGQWRCVSRHATFIAGPDAPVPPLASATSRD